MKPTNFPDIAALFLSALPRNPFHRVPSGNPGQHAGSHKGYKPKVNPPFKRRRNQLDMLTNHDRVVVLRAVKQGITPEEYRRLHPRNS